MQYPNIEEAVFLDRPNRFIAHVQTERGVEICHVKNTGRCRELLPPGAAVYVQRNEDPKRKTALDLICVKKDLGEKAGEMESDGRVRLINMDSQAPNQVVKEFLQAGKLFPDATLIRPECTYGDSRFDFYVEAGERKIFLEVKGVTLERNGWAFFPDAPTERGVKHIQELMAAVKAGYEACLLFVVQMGEIGGITPNYRTHPEFGKAVQKAKEAGVQILAFGCTVTPDSLQIGDPLPVYPEEEEYRLFLCREPLLQWYEREARDLPWRAKKDADGVYVVPDPYHVWVSEIMLQQTRVEAVKGYYTRFLQALPTIRNLAEASEDRLMKLWEGLGYYNRVRNMQKAARMIMEQYQGVFPQTYEEILSLPGIGSYTAGAIGSITRNLKRPAVDGNVLRVLARVLGNETDISLPEAKRQAERWLETIMPEKDSGNFNQALMELGACICVPNGAPSCKSCPLGEQCRAYLLNRTGELPVKSSKKARRIEKKTVLLIRDGHHVALQKRPDTGLLAGLYEFPWLEGFVSRKKAQEAVEGMGYTPLYMEKLEEAKHVFSHLEWHMQGYLVQIADREERLPERNDAEGELYFVDRETAERKYAIPSAYRAFTSRLTIRQGNENL